MLWTNRAVRRLRAIAVFPLAAIRYDAFILGGNETFFGGADLVILRRLGKRVVVIFTGSDHRPPYLSGIGIRDQSDSRALARESRRVQNRVRLAERGASEVVALPTSAQFHRRPFVNFLAVGVPFIPPPNEVPTDDDAPWSDRPIRILHSPTEPGPKGTDVIRRIIARTERAGIAVEYRELIGRPNAEVLVALRWCDFIVDEVYSDTPMAKFATEAAYFAKPAIVGSYASAYYAAARQAFPPVHLCHPNELEAAVVLLATDHDYRRKLGRRARDFVTTEWAPDKVAGRLLRVIAGAPDPAWMVRTEDLTYVHGWGISEPVLRDALRALIDAEGVAALCLPAAGRLERAVRDLAGQG